MIVLLGHRGYVSHFKGSNHPCCHMFSISKWMWYDIGERYHFFIFHYNHASWSHSCSIYPSMSAFPEPTFLVVGILVLSPLLRDKLNISRIGWASRGPDRLGPIGEAEAEYRYADRCEGRPVRCRNREAVGKIFRCRDYTRLRGEMRRDHRGLEPKSKRGWRKQEDRVRRTGDTQGHGPSTQKRKWTPTQRDATKECVY